MEEAAAFGLVCFVSLFAVVAFVTLVVFAVMGQIIFRLFGISVESMKVVGGIIFFLIGYDMLQAQHTRTKYDEASPREADGDVALTPLGIPMIAGPGAITNVIVRWNEADSTPRRAALLAAIVVVMFTTLALLLAARRVARVLGEAGNRVLLRLMGLITMVIAVELFFGGLTPIVQRMSKGV
jgi:multiple antibiotic resistance protein